MGAVLLAFLFCIALGGCGQEEKPEYAPASGKPFPVRVQLDWFAEPQHGGLYQALAKGYFKEEGLEVELLPGGSNVFVTEFVGTGRADIGQSASTQVMRAIARGAPLVNFVSNFHRLPSSLLMHENNPVDSFGDLDGKTIIGRAEAVYIPYLKATYGIDFNVMPQTFGLGAFASNPETIQEGYFIAEPFYLEQKGIAVKWLPLWESGYEPYASLFANTTFAREHPEALRAFTRAYLRGWRDYLENDPGPANKRIMAANPKASPAFLEYSRQMIIEHQLAKGDPAKGETYGLMFPARYAKEIAILEEAGVLEPGIMSVERAMTLDFLPDETRAKAQRDDTP